MNPAMYHATGVAVRTAERLLRLRIRASGLEHLPDQPTLFVVNHFTHFETVLVPYVLYRADRRRVRILAADPFFRGLLGRYLRSCGVLSTADARRDETIIGELMTRRHDWVIYPEGGLVKSKATVQGRRLHLELPQRSGPPRTGAAVLALRAEIAKRNYLRAAARGDRRRMRAYEERFGLRGPESLRLDSVAIVPVTITYYPLRNDGRAGRLAAALLRRRVGARAAEELRVELSLLLGSEISVHFGRPVDVARYVHGSVARRVAHVLRPDQTSRRYLRRRGTALTGVAMRQLYGNVELGLEHLFCAALRQLPTTSVPVERLHAALYLAANRLADHPAVRVRDSLRAESAALVESAAPLPLQRIVELACREGVLTVRDGRYGVRREVMEARVPFDEIRLRAMWRVIANEAAQVSEAWRVVGELVRQPAARVRRGAAAELVRADQAEFEHAAAQAGVAASDNGRDTGAPFLLAGGEAVGVVLVHGYLACPGQVRLLAEALHRQGHTVYAVRLAGHGTRPEDLLSVRWEQWLASVRRGYAVVRQRCERVVLVGLSLGGVLVLHLAAASGCDVAGVVTLNAPFRLRDLRAPLVPVVVHATGMLRAARIMDGHVMRPLRRAESPQLHYSVDYLRAVLELRRAVRAARRVLRRVTAPVLIVQSSDDPVVATGGARLVRRRVGSQRVWLHLIRCNRHVILDGSTAEPVAQRIAEFVAEVRGRPA